MNDSTSGTTPGWLDVLGHWPDRTPLPGLPRDNSPEALAEWEAQLRAALPEAQRAEDERRRAQTVPNRAQTIAALDDVLTELEMVRDTISDALDEARKLLRRYRDLAEQLVVEEEAEGDE